jgi:hypothetical protein
VSTSRDRASTAAGLVALLLGGTLALGGCGGSSDQADAHPTPSGSATAPGGSSSSPSTSPSSGTGVEPAAGKVVDTSWFTARVPKGYDVVVSGKDFSISAGGPDADLHFSMIGMNGRQLSLSQLARQARGSLPGLGHARLGHTTLGGEPAYLLAASKPFDNVSVVGLERDDTMIHLEVDSYGTLAAHRKLLDSILATWQWK